ncbi:helix-turn-helix domain-containing protein [Sulfurimonas sp. C5]|uniref:MarR family winged helix-turn-helix transcriptional regulator n=1 Tax=Sulfurimonas sp. C5 TaxID=3036947 RepID=UPI002455AC5E|nr:helix-turn-helix domain-containing protein [Sulfurimonas sp. C5]MDH4944428.1 helix-turn-helix domain-containing protein [Sulfurimonas sp. C5]
MSTRFTMSLCFLSLETGKIFNKVILQRLQQQGFEGLSEALIILFPYIDQAGEISSSELSRQLGYSRQAMHKNIKKLEELDYVQLSTEKNQKEKMISFTAKSKNLMAEANKIIEEIEKELSTLIGKEELETYKSNQAKIYASLNSLL